MSYPQMQVVTGEVYSKQIGRVRLDAEPARTGRMSVLSIADGFNDWAPVKQNNLTIEELRDLRYLIDRAIAAHESFEERHT